MTPQQIAHEKLVEDVTATLCNLDEGLDPYDTWGKRLLIHGRNAPHRGDCTKESFTCPRCLYVNEIKRGETILSLISARLADVTPEMVEAWKDNALGDYASEESAAAKDWRAMLSASALVSGANVT